MSCLRWVFSDMTAFCLLMPLITRSLIVNPQTHDHHHDAQSPSCFCIWLLRQAPLSKSWIITAYHEVEEHSMGFPSIIPFSLNWCASIAQSRALWQSITFFREIVCETEEISLFCSGKKQDVNQSPEISPQVSVGVDREIWVTAAKVTLMGDQGSRAH